MRVDRIPEKDLSPFAHWMMRYVKEQDISLSALSRQSNVSQSALRYLVIDASRTPTLETCLKLAHATNTPVDELLELANSAGDLPNQESLKPGRWELTQIFNTLPLEYRQA